MAQARPLVLVVDGDLAGRDSYKFSLELDGLEVATCRSGTELLTHPRLLRACCLVLVDHVPILDGFGVLAQLKSHNSRIPVILITGHATAAFRHRAAMAGVQHVVEKPLLDSALFDSIQAILGRAPLLGITT